MMIMSVYRESVSELWLPSDVLFNPQVRYEHVEPWWNNIDGGKLLTRPPEFSGNCTSYLVVNQEELAKEWWILPCKASLFKFKGIFKVSLNLTTWGSLIFLLAFDAVWSVLLRAPLKKLQIRKIPQCYYMLNWRLRYIWYARRFGTWIYGWLVLFFLFYASVTTDLAGSKTLHILNLYANNCGVINQTPRRTFRNAFRAC
jgi:hypothetical protein